MNFISSIGSRCSAVWKRLRTSAARFVLLMTSAALGRSVAFRPMLLPNTVTPRGRKCVSPASSRKRSNAASFMKLRIVVRSTGLPPFITACVSAAVGLRLANSTAALARTVASVACVTPDQNCAATGVSLPVVHASFMIGTSSASALYCGEFALTKGAPPGWFNRR